MRKSVQIGIGPIPGALLIIGGTMAGSPPSGTGNSSSPPAR